MRLINVQTTRLVQFFGGDIPAYAILSHTWGKHEDELTIQDLNASTDTTDRHGPGWDKFAGLCRQASADGLEWAWLDTWCIDKTNSTELGEAINSMFRWYKKAKVCYAYLSDVDDERRFEHSRWFTRGWTLQELLAPRHIRFHDSQWNIIGTKRELSADITNITGIPRPFLLGIAPLREASVAQRMCWAARRETKRAEDAAYCLLGIFGFNMPMIYGEDNMAFIRLQEEIMRHIKDDSILAWQADPIDGDDDALPIGALAASPAAFAFSGDVIPGDRHIASFMEPLHVQGGTLVARRPLVHLSHKYLVLDCYRNQSPGMRMAIPISTSSPGLSSDNTYAKTYTRLASPNLMHSSDMPMEDLNHAIRIHATRSQVPSSTAPQRAPRIYIDNAFEKEVKLVDVIPRDCWDQETDMITPQVNENTESWQAFMRFETSETCSHDFIVVVGTASPHTELAHVNHHVMICKKQTALNSIAESFARFRPEALDSRYACNEIMNLEVAMHHELVGRQMMFVMRFLEIGGVATTVDGSYEILYLTQERTLISLLTRDKVHARQIEERSSEVGEMERAQKDEQKKLDSVERSIKALEAQRPILQKLLELGTSRMSAAQTDLERHREERMNLADDLNTACSELAGLRTSVSFDTSVVEDWTASLASQLMVKVRDFHLCALNPAIGQLPDQKKQLLFCAAGEGWLAVVCLLVAYGADVNTTDHSGTPLLAYAHKAGNSELISFLIEHGADEDYETPANVSVKVQPSHRETSVLRLTRELGKGPLITNNSTKAAADA